MGGTRLAAPAVVARTKQRGQCNGLVLRGPSTGRAGAVGRSLPGLGHASVLVVDLHLDPLPGVLLHSRSHAQAVGGAGTSGVPPHAGASSPGRRPGRIFAIPSPLEPEVVLGRGIDPPCPDPVERGRVLPPLPSRHTLSVRRGHRPGLSPAEHQSQRPYHRHHILCQPQRIVQHLVLLPPDHGPGGPVQPVRDGDYRHRHLRLGPALDILAELGRLRRDGPVGIVAGAQPSRRRGAQGVAARSRGGRYARTAVLPDGSCGPGGRGGLHAGVAVPGRYGLACRLVVSGQRDHRLPGDHAAGDSGRTLLSVDARGGAGDDHVRFRDGLDFSAWPGGTGTELQFLRRRAIDFHAVRRPCRQAAGRDGLRAPRAQPGHRHGGTGRLRRCDRQHSVCGLRAGSVQFHFLVLPRLLRCGSDGLRRGDGADKKPGAAPARETGLLRNRLFRHERADFHAVPALPGGPCTPSACPLQRSG